MAITLYYRIIKTKKESKVVCAIVRYCSAILLPQDLFLPVCTQFMYFLLLFLRVFYGLFFLSPSPFLDLILLRLTRFFASISLPSNVCNYFAALNYFYFRFRIYYVVCSHGARHFNPKTVIVHDFGPPEIFCSIRHLFVCVVFVG